MLKPKYSQSLSSFDPLSLFSMMAIRRRKILPAHLILWILTVAQVALSAQQNNQLDSLQQLQPVTVQAYVSHQPLSSTPASIGIINTQQLQQHAGESLLPALNTIPGVRMEERSPGSYRLSIRGSLLRSPFGVRNVKVYIDEFPLTDAGGNTYLNLIDALSIERVEILKGPDGSLFGANSGGVVLLNTKGQSKDSSKISLGLTGGSYGSLHENASLKLSSDRSQFSFNQAWQRSDGYRENSAMQRHYLQAAQRWWYGKNNSIKLFAFYSDLQYETPGGLTQPQYDADPRQARPAGGPNPGAVEQQSGIYNKTFFGGISNELHLSKNLRHVVSFFGSHTDFENPFITNYEVRVENNLGARTYLEYTDAVNANLQYKWSLGLEGQQGWHDITNYQNNGGVQGSEIASDELNIDQLFYFTRLSTTLYEKLTAEFAISLNTLQFSNTGSTSQGNRKYNDQWMPRVALSYQLTSDVALRASLSRGYSPPTLAEIRPSGNVINQQLQSESGWNTEAGFRMNAWNNRLEMDASVFRFDLTDAIVRREDQDGIEYFTNAGGTKQTGIETLISAWLMSPKSTGLLRAAQLTTSVTINHFEFDNYQDATSDYSGNKLTGVPQHVFAISTTIRLPEQVSLFVALNATGRIPLNDANNAFADAYQILRSKINWSTHTTRRVGITIFAGADNITNETYSLGNDINAFGGRYFNAAALFNFYAGVKLRFQ
jgi:iron complex outermembrane receptor protein